MRFKSLVTPALFLLLEACAPKRIPGTDIVDTTDTRAILNIVERYRSAVESRDSDGVLKLVSMTFKDDGGTATPEDDLDYQALQKKLPERFAKLEDVHLDLSIRKVSVNEDTGKASVIYYYNMSFKMPGLSSRARSESEIKQMWLKREKGGEWKITSGV
jgi:hypothetical protein